jgi:hypothetical protein
METVKGKSSENLHFEVNESGDGLKTCRSNSTSNMKSICLWVNCSMTDVGNFLIYMALHLYCSKIYMALHLYCSKFIKILWLVLHKRKAGSEVRILHILYGMLAERPNAWPKVFYLVSWQSWTIALVLKNKFECIGEKSLCRTFQIR